MKLTLLFIACLLSFGLISCNQDDNTHETQIHGNHVSMQHLTMLLEHAISMMAQGASLKLQGQAHGDEMLAQSADLLRRAMSGPEMAAMHKGGQGESPAMQHTHDLGAAAFDLLEMMMELKTNQAPKNASMLHHALNMAAQGASMKLLADMGMSKDIDVSMQDHGLQMQRTSMQLYQEISSDTPYSKAVLKIMHLLVSDAPKAMQHMH